MKFNIRKIEFSCLLFLYMLFDVVLATTLAASIVVMLTTTDPVIFIISIGYFIGWVACMIHVLRSKKKEEQILKDLEDD